MDDGIYFSDMRKELIAQALTFIRTAHESRNVDKLYRCGRELFRIIHFCEYVEPLVRAAVVCGVDALFLEVHDNPEEALSDGPNMVYLDKLEGLLKQALAIHKIVQAEENN